MVRRKDSTFKTCIEKTLPKQVRGKKGEQDIAKCLVMGIKQGKMI